MFYYVLFTELSVMSIDFRASLYVCPKPYKHGNASFFFQSLLLAVCRTLFKIKSGSFTFLHRGLCCCVIQNFTHTSHMTILCGKSCCCFVFLPQLNSKSETMIYSRFQCLTILEYYIKPMVKRDLSMSAVTKVFSIMHSTWSMPLCEFLH